MSSPPGAPSRLCRHCGNWSSSPEFGMDSGSGYCEVWEKLTVAAHTCDRFMTREEFRREQNERLERMLENGELEE